MKFINYLESMTDIGFYPLTSLMIFFIFFIGVTVFIVKGSKDYFTTLANLPLNKDGNSILTSNTQVYDTEVK